MKMWNCQRITILPALCSTESIASNNRVIDNKRMFRYVKAVTKNVSCQDGFHLNKLRVIILCAKNRYEYIDVDKLIGIDLKLLR